LISLVQTHVSHLAKYIFDLILIWFFSDRTSLI